MSSRVRILLFVVAIGVLAIMVLWMGQSSDIPRQEMERIGDSVARYAIDDFFAACRVRPKGLIEHAYFGSLPIDAFTPSPLSLERLEAMGVEELVVFCGPATDSNPANRRAAVIEWA